MSDTGNYRASLTAAELRRGQLMMTAMSRPLAEAEKEELVRLLLTESGEVPNE